MTRWAQANAGPIAAGLVAIAAIAMLQVLQLSVFERVGQLLFDSYQRASPREYEDVPVRVVDIDEETIRRLGQWPWPRTDIARLTQRLSDAGAAVIAFDIVFSEPDRTSPARIAERLRLSGEASPALATLAKLPDHDAVLAESIAKGPVVAGYFLLNDRRGPVVEPKAGIAVAGSLNGLAVPRFERAIESLAPLNAAAAGSGFVSLAGDSDGIVRQVPLIALQGGQVLPSLSLDAVRLAQGAGAILVRTSDASGETRGSPGQVVSVKTGAFEVPTTESGSLWMHYTPPQPERVVPAWKILDGTMDRAALERAFSGRIVFVGAGAVGLRDLVSTPLSERELGVMVHAQAAEQIVLGRFLIRPDWAPGAESALLLVLGLGLIMILPRLGAAWGALLAASLITALLAGSWIAFSPYHFLLNPTYPVMALALAYVVQTVLVFYREERRRSYIHNAFDRYLSPELVKRIAADPGRLELGGEERDMTVLFCDIRGFSHISEGLGPQDIIRFLISFLTPMCDILLARKATLDKFIGDAIVAFWNAPLDDPDQHENAARAALEMVVRLNTLNRDMPSRPGQPWPGEVRVGIGLNSGLCCVGNMGSMQRLSYSLIGDTVNLASRIEGLTKYYGVAIALGGALQDRLRSFAVIELDRVRVVGRDAPETVYALLGDETLASSSEFARLIEHHGQLLKTYRARDWDGARRWLDVIRPLAQDFGLEQLYVLYGQRIQDLAESPLPEEWDGVFQAKTK